MLFASLLFLSGCGGGSSSDLVLLPDAKNPQNIAIDKIMAYAKDQTQPAPTVEDYADAGVEGVTAENLDEINALVASLTPEDVDSPEKIQDILDEYGLSIPTDPGIPTDPDDTTAPVIELLGNTPVTVTKGDTYTDAGATASDDIDGDITANIVTVNKVNADTLGTYTVTYNVSDTAGNAAKQVSRMVYVIRGESDIIIPPPPSLPDTTAPVITLLGSSPVSVSLGATYIDAGANAFDNVNGDITSDIATVSTVNTAILGDYNVTYNVSDAAGNAATEVIRTVNVVNDATAPVITLLGDTPVTMDVNTEYTDAGATAEDDVDGDITANIVTVNLVDVNNIGTYTVTYNVSDAATNTATEVVRTVNVIDPSADDNVAPVITLRGSTPVTMDVNTEYVDAGATAEDDVDGDITANIVTVNLVDTNNIGTYTVTYNVSDAATNAAIEVTRTVNVVEPGTEDDVVGQTIEFDGVDGAMFSFYINNKFVKTTCGSTCSNGEGQFDFIGEWSKDTGGALILKDADGATIDQGAIDTEYPIYHFTMLNDKVSGDPAHVQGNALREKLPTRIEFVYFRDPAPETTTPTMFSAFGYSTDTDSPSGSGGTWSAVEGKIVAAKGAVEFLTYAFDRGSIAGSIVTVTNNDELIKVIVIDEFYKLQPSTDSDTPVETPAALTVADFDGKLMTINSRRDGPSARYFEPRADSIDNGPEDGIIWAVGIGTDGIPWGGKGDHWTLSENGTAIDAKIHYNGIVPSTKESFEFDAGTLVQGTYMSRYLTDTEDHIGTSSLARFTDY